MHVSWCEFAQNSVLGVCVCGGEALDPLGLELL